MIRENVGDFALNERLAANQAYGKLDLKPILAQALEAAPGMRLVDVACGEGRWTVFLAGIVAGGLTVGLDISPSLVAQAVGLGHEKQVDLCLAVADGLLLPLANSSFDRVTCLYALYQFPDVAAGLAEMLRVLRSNGKIVLLGPARDNNQELYGYMRPLGLACGERWAERYTSPA